MRVRQMIRGEAGYTSLVEATAAVAIGLSLVAMLTPVIIGSTDDADLTRAATDVEAIRLAITIFNSDVTEFPIRGLRRDKVSIPARAGDAPMLCLRSGNEPANDPSGAPPGNRRAGHTGAVGNRWRRTARPPETTRGAIARSATPTRT